MSDAQDTPVSGNISAAMIGGKNVHEVCKRQWWPGAVMLESHVIIFSSKSALYILANNLSVCHHCSDFAQALIAAL